MMYLLTDAETRAALWFLAFALVLGACWPLLDELVRLVGALADLVAALAACQADILCR